MTKEFENRHPDFKIISVSDHFQLWLIEWTTSQLKERFGLYDRLWKAEREARKMQKWRNAETWE